MEKRGKFIVIDGLDGSGKSVQTELIVKRLKEEGYNVYSADFPQYGNWSAAFVERYLRGEFGGLNEISAERASLFYALDRYAASFQIKKWLDDGAMVISNRYVSSSKGHQLGKITDLEKMKNFLNWLNHLEYELLNIPKPDLTLFLHMTPEIGQKLVDRKCVRAYTLGKKRDIHEADVEHLRNAERAYLFCLENDNVENWKKIICFANDEPRDIKEIHEEIYGVVKEMLVKD